MDPDRKRRSGSLGFGVVLIALGLLFLISNLMPRFDPWPMMERYWPAILIVLGIGMLMDRMRMRNNPQSSGSAFLSGTAITIFVIVLLFGISVRESGASNPIVHDPHHVIQKPSAQSVTAQIEMPAGELSIEGGSTNLLDADFVHDEYSGEPRVDYTSSGTTGRLDISQHERGGLHFGRTENKWDLRFGDTPIEMELSMGAGEGTLNLKGLDISRLKIEIGAGQINLDLTGDRKRDLTGDIQGGVGEAVVHLPRNIGVEIHASGGIGSIEPVGLRLEGGRYVNDALGKSAATIRLNIEGGIGNIRLVQEP
jgi:hypothetical protein